MTVISVFSYGHLSDFLKSDFLFHIHFSVVICDFLVISSYITIVPMHVPFRIHYRNNLIYKKDSNPIPRLELYLTVHVKVVLLWFISQCFLSNMFRHLINLGSWCARILCRDSLKVVTPSKCSWINFNMINWTFSPQYY
jgi:hypothetical protein